MKDQKYLESLVYPNVTTETALRKLKRRKLVQLSNGNNRL